MTDTEKLDLEKTAEFAPVKRSEILAWASYDIANSTYAAVVATAVYNAYFVDVVAAHVPGAPPGFGTELLTVVISVSSLLVVFTAPVIGTICDATASKKRWLFFSTFACIFATAGLGCLRPGQYIESMLMMIAANAAFFTGENLIAAFLPELAHKQDMGRISSIGWAAGYVGGLLSLGACFGFMSWAQKMGQTSDTYVPNTMYLCAAYFAIMVTPTFIFMRERAVADPLAGKGNYVLVGLKRLQQTISHARHYRDLFRFLIALFVYSCGTTTIVHLASVYAQQVFGFSAKDLVTMMLVINITAAVGAVVFGFIQDKIGSIKTLGTTLTIWLVAIVIGCTAQDRVSFWLAGNLVGIAMGASGSVGRALVGQFSPPCRSGEFLGLWGVAVKLATCVGAVSFGLTTYLTHSNYRLALAQTSVFFIGGILLLFGINERRGCAAAHTDVDMPL